VPPRCQHFGRCGGCQLQHVPYPDQLAHKRDHLAALLRDTLGARAPVVRPPIGSPVGADGMPWAFRHKAAFVFGPGAGSAPFVLGHFAEGSQQVVPVVECPVHAPRANRIAFALRDALARARIPAAGPRLDGVLRHLLVRTTHDERQAVAMLVVTRNDRRLRAPIRALLDGPDAPTGFLVNVHDRPGPYMVGRETLKIAGRAQVREAHLGLPFLISPTAFFQTNVDAAAELLRLVLAEAPEMPPLRVLDLYAGSGLFSLPLAARGHVVTAVEENAQAMDDAARNLQLAALPPARVRFLCARVEDALPRLSRERIDLAVIDPPRQGCPPEVLDRLFHDVAPPRAVYVSCHPEALATELPGILDAGYTVEMVQPVDMFPHTLHIETVVTLRRTASVRRLGDNGAAPARARRR
jgi:23S rRNA (uracil1939-C5)-methyltransferase